MWPNVVLNAYTSIDQESEKENRWYSLYSAVLGTLFPLSDEFIITPECSTTDNKMDNTRIDFVTIFIVEHRQHRIFFMEVKTPFFFTHKSRRTIADLQMRSHFNNLLADDQLMPVIYGISALGTRLAFYHAQPGDAANIMPPQIFAPHGDYTCNTAPKRRWARDLFSDEGERKLREVANNTKRMLWDRINVPIPPYFPALAPDSDSDDALDSDNSAATISGSSHKSNSSSRKSNGSSRKSDVSIKSRKSDASSRKSDVSKDSDASSSSRKSSDSGSVYVDVSMSSSSDSERS